MHLRCGPVTNNQLRFKHEASSDLGKTAEVRMVITHVKEEIRQNAIKRIQQGEELFPGVLGYENTVIPQLENALLAGHDFIFLGERGQAKTRMIRGLTDLLDEWMPIIAGSEINDDPYNQYQNTLLTSSTKKRRNTYRMGAQKRKVWRETRNSRYCNS